MEKVGFTDFVGIGGIALTLIIVVLRPLICRKKRITTRSQQRLNDGLMKKPFSEEFTLPITLSSNVRSGP
jgi:hypothetical protein